MPALTLPPLISSGMVIQRDRDITLWGRSPEGRPVSVEFRGCKLETVADCYGSWSVTLPPQSAGGPFELCFESADGRIRLTDVYVGELWFCGGQSNMELPMSRLHRLYGAEMTDAHDELLRGFFVTPELDFSRERSELGGGHWSAVNPQTVRDFYGVAYFFGKALRECLGVPVGLLQCAVGGTPAEAWMSESALAEFPAALKELERCKRPGFIESIQKAEEEAFVRWHEELDRRDEGFPISEDGNWTTEAPCGPGAFWLKQELCLEDDVSGQEALLRLGCIVDSDSAYINGELVGNTSYRYPPREYPVRAGLLHKGANTLLLRVVGEYGPGGFVEDKTHALEINGREISLGDNWLYKHGCSMPPKMPQTFFEYKPSGLYNAMIAPMTRYAVRGVIWYQGESNTAKPSEYGKLMESLLRSWRQAWGSPLPFLFVQLAGYMPASAEPRESAWAELREQQTELLKMPDTGMAVAIDLGEHNDIHPLNKRDVGLRLALAARALVYGESVEYSGPVCSGFELADNRKVVLSFEHAEGLKAGNTVCGFALAAADGRFVNAEACILDSGKLAVWSDTIKSPAYLRYAWADNPDKANLYNGAKLPASPFRLSLIKN